MIDHVDDRYLSWSYSQMSVTGPHYCIGSGNGLVPSDTKPLPEPLFAGEGNYRKTSNISRTLVGNKIVDNSDVVGASPVGAAPTTSSFST